MPNITLPDGKQLSFSESVTGFQLAEKISKSLSKQALIISVDGQLKDLDFKIEKDSKVKIFTSCLLYTSPSPRDLSTSRMPSSA